MLQVVMDRRLVISKTDFVRVDVKLKEFGVITISMLDNVLYPDMVTIHINGEESKMNQLLEWLANDYEGAATVV